MFVHSTLCVALPCMVSVFIHDSFEAFLDSRLPFSLTELPDLLLVIFQCQVAFAEGSNGVCISRIYLAVYEAHLGLPPLQCYHSFLSIAMLFSVYSNK